MDDCEHELLFLRTCLQTKSSEKAAAPVLNQISYILLMIDSWPQSKDKQLTAYRVEQQTRKLSEFVQGLIHNLHQFKPGSLAKSSAGGTDVICNQLDLCSRNVQLASAALVNSTDIHSTRITFIHHLRELQQCIAQVFLSVEEVEDMKLNGIICWIKELLRNLSLVVSLVDLVKTFKQYTEALLILFNLIAKQQRDLKSNKKRCSLGTAALTIKKLTPNINKCCQTCIKYSNNTEAKEHKAKVFSQMTSALDEITGIVEDKSWPEDSEGMSEGLFVSAVDQVLTYLKDKAQDLDDGEFDLLIGTIIRHSLSVVSLSDDTHKRQLASQSCMMVLSMAAAIIPLCKNSRHHSELQQVREDFKQQCELLVSEIHDLERNVNSMLIESIVDVFKETEGPLDRLVKAVHARRQIKQSTLMEAVEPFIDEFQEHSRLMYKVARLVADSSNNAQNVDKIMCSLCRLEKLHPQIVSSILERQQMLSADAASRVLQRWRKELNVLCTAIDEISDTTVFTEVTVELLAHNGGKLKSLLKEERIDMHEFADLIRAQLGLTNHLVAMLSQHSYQNLSVNLEQLHLACTKLKQVISEVNKAASLLTMNESEGSLRESVLTQNTVLERCTTLIKSILCLEIVNDSILHELQDSADLDSTPVDIDITARYSPQEVPEEEQTLKDAQISDGAQMWLSLEPTSYNINSSNSPYSGDAASLGLSAYAGEPDVDLNEQVQKLLEFALACDVTSTELCCNELMETANDVTSIANSLLPFVDNSDEKQRIKKLVTVIPSQTVEISAMARQLALSDVNIAHKLSSAMNSWCRNIEELECCCDSLLTNLLKFTSELCAAIQLNNPPLIASARQKFERTNQLLDSILSCDGEDAFAGHSIIGSFRLTNERLQKKICSSHRGECKPQKLKSLCRLWACNILSARQTVSAVLERDLLLYCNLSSSDYSSCLGLMQRIKYIWNVLSSRAHEKTTLCCRKLIADMTALLDSTPVTILSHDDNFTDLQACVLTLRWTHKAAEFFRSVDALLEPHCAVLNKLAVNAVAVQTSHKDTKQSSVSTYHQLKTSLTDTVQTLRTQYVGLGDTAPSHSELLSNISAKLEDLMAISEQLSLEPVTDQLLTAYKAEQRLFIVLVLELRQQVTYAETTADEKQTFERILGRQASKPDSLDLLLESSVKQNSTTNHSITVSSGKLDSSVQNGNQTLQSKAKLKFMESPFARAVRSFKGSLGKWADKTNVVVKAAKDLANNLQDISLYVKYQEGPISSRRQLFDMSKQVVAHSFTITKFCAVISKYSLAGWRFSEELMYHSKQVTFYSEQLSMLTSVKRSTSPFDLTIKALATNGDNLLKSILKAFEAAESILLKGLKEPPASAEEEQEIYTLAIKWRSQLEKHRHSEINYTDVNDLGLRVVSKVDNGPHLSEICQPGS